MSRSALRVLTAAAVCCGALGIAVLPASADPSAHITGITVSGNGCPPGTAKITVATDGRSASVTFSPFETQITTTQVSTFANCKLNIQTAKAAGTDYSLNTTVLGRVSATDSNVQGRLTGSASGSLVSKKDSQTFTGPVDKTYAFSTNSVTARSPETTVTAVMDLRLDLTRRSTANNSGHISVDTVNLAIG